MTDAPRQLSLFASSMESCGPAAPSSQPSNAPGTSSSEACRTAPGGATPTIPTRPATERCTHDAAASADTSIGGARSTAGSSQLLTLPIITEAMRTDPMLAIPRPKSTGECSQEARPCPWVGCRHHLLLEVAASKNARPTRIRLNTATQPRRWGRRAGLSSSAAEALVRVWMDDALEILQAMPYTCTLDVVRDYPDGAPARVVAAILGVSEQAIDQEVDDLKANDDVRHVLKECL